MKLRDLQYLVAVGRHLHFGKAAKACNVSQPTLSIQIRKLEDRLGIPLFERDGRKVVATAAGKAVIEQAEKVVSNAEAILDTANMYRDPLSGPLRIGMIVTLGTSLSAGLIHRIRAEAPDITLHLRESMTHELLDDVRSGALDAAIIATEEDLPDLMTRPVFFEPFLIGHAPDHPVAQKEKISREDLINGPLLFLSQGHCLRDQGMSLCRINELQESALLEAGSLDSIFTVAATGEGIALVPALSIPRSETRGNKRLIIRKLDFMTKGEKPGRTVRLVWRTSFPRVQVLDLISKILLEMVEDEGLDIIDKVALAN